MQAHEGAARRPALAQFEITTRCNFTCFYCAGRAMHQGDMPFEMFDGLLTAHVHRYGAPGVVSLQGEGEPTLHPDFFRMAGRVREIGSEPYTITNGTYHHPARFVNVFSRVGVSVDTLDAAAARQIGRHNLPRVLGFIEALAPHVRVVIHSIARRKATAQIAQWCQQRGFQHVVQPLQTKADYSYLYPTQTRGEPAASGRFSCSYLAHHPMRYYALSGAELPCSFIKDLTRYPGLPSMLCHQNEGTRPPCCSGCRYGTGGAAVPAPSGT